MMTMPSDAGKVALITGGGAGIGRAAANALAARGFAVSIVDLSAESAEKAAAEIRGAGGRALAFAGDIASRDAQSEAIESTVAEFGRLDAVFANAGDQDVAGDVMECDEASWRRHIDISLNGTFLTAHLSMPHLIEHRGVLLATASDAGVRPGRGIVAYNTVKSAVIALIRSIAIDFGDRGVRANVICPGETETDYHNSHMTDSPTVDDWRNLVPLGRFGQPEDIAKVAVHLLTEESAYTSGLVYVVDGAASVGYYPIRVWDDPTDAAG